jgi:hypothetical protein
MRKRYKLNQRKSERMFTRTASKTHYKNVTPQPKRGGIRL